MEVRPRRVFGLPLGEWFSAFVSPTYLPMTLALYTAMYVVLQFVLLPFNAADTADRWAFELTPAFLLGIPDLQLVFLGALVAGAEACLQSSVAARQRYAGTGLVGFMAANFVLGLYAAGPDPLGADAARVVMLGVVLAIVVLDHLGIVSGGGAAAAGAGAAAEPVFPSAPPAPRPVDVTADVDVVIAELEARGTPAEPLEPEIAELEALAQEAAVEAEPEDRKEKEEEEELEQNAEFAIKELDAFETWLENKEKIEEEARKAAEARKGEKGKAR